MGGLIFLIFFVIIVMCSFIKKVPPDSAIIIDRNDHYLKTIKMGLYFFVPGKDVITTFISTEPHTQFYTQISDSHDGVLYQLTYSVTYKVYNINSVLESLKSNRRSVNDIIQSCVHTSFGNFDKKDLSNTEELITEIKRRLAGNLDSFEIELISFDFRPPLQLPSGARNKIFAPHISEGIKSIKYK